MEQFSDKFRAGLHDLMKWRRDVRHFKTYAVPAGTLQAGLDSFRLAPLVGLSEPWRILRVTSPTARAAVLVNFQAANAVALQGYDGDQARLYASLKLSGIRDAPEQIAIFFVDHTTKGRGLAVATLPEMRRYSVVGVITLMWLTVRSHGLGVGWISVLDPDRLARDLDAPTNWSRIAYLCLGWPKEISQTPELETKGWETRSPRLKIETR